MYSGVGELYFNQSMYCKFSIMYQETKWWKFSKRKIIKDEIDWFYPLMKAEVELINPTKE